MPPWTGARVGLALLAGVVWGVIGLLLASTALGTSVWGGVAIAPVIGLVIGYAFRGFRDQGPGVRIALALVSLYLAAGLFGLAAGIADAARPIPNRDPVAVVVQSVVGVWWGITFTGYLVVLWPLAYLTHTLLGRASPRGPAGTFTTIGPS
jgi:hypothetical protein